MTSLLIHDVRGRRQMNQVIEAVTAALTTDMIDASPLAPAAAKAACEAIARLVEDARHTHGADYEDGWNDALDRVLDLLTGCQIPADGAA